MLSRLPNPVEIETVSQRREELSRIWWKTLPPHICAQVFPDIDASFEPLVRMNQVGEIQCWQYDPQSDLLVGNVTVIEPESSEGQRIIRFLARP